MFKLKQLAACVALSLTATSVWAEGVTVLHVGDQESWLLSAQGNLRDSPAQAISFYGGVDRLATVIKNAETQAKAQGRTVLKLNAGDALLPGPRLTASLTNLGQAFAGGQDFYDAIALRQIGFDAAVFGNHEFDLGPDLAARFAQVSGTTYLSANLNFEATPAFSALKANGQVAASKTVTTPGGKKIGLIGATTPLLPNISSPGAVNLLAFQGSNSERQNLLAMAGLLQTEINRLRQVEGVTTVVLMSHLQNVNNERNIVIPAITGVDLVLSGGGHELMVDSDDALINGGVTPTFNSHPITAVDANGKIVPILTSHFGNRYVGQVNFTIDDNTGQFSGIESTKMMRVTGAAADADRVVGDTTLQTQVITPITNYIAALNAQIIGTTAVRLNGPTHTACSPAPCTFVAGVRNAETGLGNLVADAMRFAGKSDVAIQNGGGIRTNIASPGNVSVGDTFNILPFTNLVKRAPAMNATQLKDILEHAVINASPVGGNNGRFAQVSGMQVIYDTRLTPRASTTVGADLAPVGTGNRIRRVVLDDGTVLIDNGVVVNNTRTFSFTTIDFTAAGGDGYPFVANGVVFENDPFTITYQEALANFIQTPKAAGGLGRLNQADGDEITANLYGIENQYDAGGRLIDVAIATTTPGVTRNGSAGRDTLVGTVGDDVMTGGLGADTLTGGAGNDRFVYTSMRDAGDTITDFTPYADKLDVRSLFASLGVTPMAALTQGYIRLQDVIGGTQVLIDSDGAAGNAIAKPLLILKGLTAAQVKPARDFAL